MSVEPTGRDRLESLLEEATRSELPDPSLCAKLAREYLKTGDAASAYAWLARVGDSTGPYTAWASAAGLLAKAEDAALPTVRRSVRVAVAGSYTTAQLVPLLRLAGLRRGVHVTTYETGFDTYRQEILDPSSELYRFDPDYVVLAPHEGAARFPLLSEDPEAALADELAQWTGLWDAIAANSRAGVVQHNFVLRPDTAWGHVSGRVPGSRDELLRELNARLGRAAGDRAVVVDCDRLAAAYGKTRWFDDRYWFMAKQAVALDALPELARHTVAMIAAVGGLSSKCLVLDIDNTLWGGVIAEEGLAGIELGHGARGEAFVAFQEYVRALHARGVTLAVVSKNNDRDAREPFEAHPDMRLRMDDIAVFIANWRDKAANLRAVAAELNIGLDSLVFVDDNPAERQVIRELVPEVEVIALPPDPADYIRAVSSSLLFEVASVTAEDLRRSEHYKARAAAAALEQEASSLEEFYAGLEMEAFIAPFDELNLPRIVQLIGKTNQFNLTTRRHGRTEVSGFMDDERYVTLYLRLRDRFTDHGLVALMIAEQREHVLEIDTWLMSCRVIGRTVENKLLAHLCDLAGSRGCTEVRGTFIPSDKNAVVRDLFERLGFQRVSVGEDGRSTWTYDIDGKGVPANEHIRTAASAIGHG